MDDLDRNIVSVLLTDGRSSYADVGSRVGLSAPAVKRRVDRMLEAGAIRGFSVVVDPTVLGWQIEAYVEVYCKGTIGPDELRRSFENTPEIVSACTVSGPADALIHMRAESIQHFERTIEHLRENPRFDHTESVLVLSQLIERSYE